MKPERITLLVKTATLENAKIKMCLLGEFIKKQRILFKYSASNYF